MTERPGPAALTVVLAPRGEADDIGALLIDYAAVGLVAPFVWVDAADVGKTSVPATLVADGRASAVVLQQVLTGHRYERLRVAVLVPADAAADRRVPRAVEQLLEQVVRASAVGAPITLLRLLFTRGSAGPHGYDPALVLEGWHNLLIAPEDSAGPGLGSVVLEQLTEPLDVAQYVAPVVAAVAGLWTGIDRSVFDDLAILPGQTLRAVRAFYRQLDAAGVEDQLRLQLFSAAGRLPLPRSGQTPVVYIQDVPLAAQAVSRALWTKHRDVLRSGRVEIGSKETEQIAIGDALKTFLSFLWAALRNAPSAWLSGMLGGVQSVLATTVQHTVFGGSNSAYAVVAGGELGSWQDIGRGADQMSSALGEQPGAAHLVQADLTSLWVDYVNAALTLADGGRRTAGIDPVSVGVAVGVVHDSADVVPSAADAFTAIPASLAAVIGIPAVAGGDVLGTADLKGRLERTFADPAAGVEARRAFSDLTEWEGRAGRSYAAQVGSVLADFLGRARGEVSGLVQRIQQTANRDAVDETLRRRQRVISTITLTAGWTVFAAVLLLLIIAAIGWAEWPFALIVSAVVIAIYFIAALILFIIGQRHLFAELNLRKSQMSELEAMHHNLRAALQDVSRLSAAYGQLLAWNRVLGEVLRTPFGPVAPARPARLHLTDGLPRAMQIGVAAPSGQDAESTARTLEQRLYGIGWLSGPWERMLESAGRQLRDEPVTLFRMPGAGSGSPLDGWSKAVAAGAVRSEGANALWAQVQAMFDDPASGVAEALTGGVLIPATGQRVSPDQFNGGMLQKRTGPAAPFHASLFTDTAVTAGRSMVAIDDAAVDRRGLDYRAVVVQVGDGLPTYDFAMFAPGEDSVQFEATTKIRLPGAVDDDTPPESGSLVF
ncbi:hypothetical protein ACAG26_04665 [Mycobacterium sp. pUA109]